MQQLEWPRKIQICSCHPQIKIQQSLPTAYKIKNQDWAWFPGHQSLSYTALWSFWHGHPCMFSLLCTQVCEACLVSCCLSTRRPEPRNPDSSIWSQLKSLFLRDILWPQTSLDLLFICSHRSLLIIPFLTFKVFLKLVINYSLTFSWHYFYEVRDCVDFHICRASNNARHAVGLHKHSKN